jgi:molybdopterin-synthase adenylyltransferase
MNDNELLRYSRHIFLDEIDLDGQEKLQQATVMIIGCGGLGNACIPILAGAGIGHLILCDHDVIEYSNLQRQFAFTPKDIHHTKVDVIAHYLHQRNSDLNITPIDAYINTELLEKYVPKCDVIVDCTDNSKTRHLINQAAVKYNIPLVSASVIQFSGQLAVFDSRLANSPCYACLFPELNTEDKSCSQNGVFSPLVHQIGAAQAAEVMKLIIGFGTSSAGKMVQFEGIDFSTYHLALEKNPHCPVCSSSNSLHSYFSK